MAHGVRKSIGPSPHPRQPSAGLDRAGLKGPSARPQGGSRAGHRPVGLRIVSPRSNCQSRVASRGPCRRDGEGFRACRGPSGRRRGGRGAPEPASGRRGAWTGLADVQPASCPDRFCPTRGGGPPLDTPRRRSAPSVPGRPLRVAGWVRPALRAGSKNKTPTRVQGIEGQGFTDLAGRKPRKSTRMPGSNQSRVAARQYLATSPQDPPRSTRTTPAGGPVGSSTMPPMPS